MIDKLSLTIYKPPDHEYLNIHGDFTEDEYRQKLYKEMWVLDKCAVFSKPHKFGELTNLCIPYTKVDLNPKYFKSYYYLLSYICLLFDAPDLKPEDFNVSRIDIAVDIEDFPVENILSMLHIKRIRPESFNLHKGTIYAGTNPKIRIYDKVKEIKARLKKGYEITEYEKELFESGKSWTRFEIQIRPEKMNLKNIVDNHLSLISYFDRLEIFNFNGNEVAGIMQFIYKLVNRKFRKQMEELKDTDMLNKIKDRCITSLSQWFCLNGYEIEEPF